MWSSPEDRRRAAIQAKKLTPAQEAKKAQREKVWNAAFDSAISHSMPPQVFRMIRFDHPSYLEDRKQLFEQWDLDQRVELAEREQKQLVRS